MTRSILIAILAILGTILTAVGGLAPGADGRLAWAGVLLVEVAFCLAVLAPGV